MNPIIPMRRMIPIIMKNIFTNQPMNLRIQLDVDHSFVLPESITTGTLADPPFTMIDN